MRTVLGAGIPKRVGTGNVLVQRADHACDGVSACASATHGGAVIEVIRTSWHKYGYPLSIQSIHDARRASLCATTFIIINIIVDMLYILIDPRIRTV